MEVSGMLLYALLRQFHVVYQYVMDKLTTVGLKHRFAAFGTNNYLYHPFYISSPQFAEIGSNVHINRGAFIRAEGGLKIGDNVHISRNLTLYTINHNYMGDALPYDHTVIRKPVVIEKNVWIGINVTITPGVTIGEGAIIGAGTVVAKDIPSMAIVGSQPARIITYRDEEHYRRLESAGKYGGVNGRPLPAALPDEPVTEI
jgi:acetyltransferase-like isoleucine patch superfamily enzyme